MVASKKCTKLLHHYLGKRPALQWYSFIPTNTKRDLPSGPLKLLETSQTTTVYMLEFYTNKPLGIPASIHYSGSH